MAPAKPFLFEYTFGLPERRATLNVVEKKQTACDKPEANFVKRSEKT